MLKPGDTAPEIDALSSDGTRFRLSDQESKLCTIVYFFPKAFTPACTIEIRNFRDHQAAIEAKNAMLIGVSLDKPDRQCQFAKAEKIDFALIGDESRTISDRYGVVWPVVRRDRRATFMINEQGMIDDVIHHEVQVYRHLDDVLSKLGAPAIDAVHET